jgi:hypothetical protein
MSNFSYPCQFPVGITILDLTDSDITIEDLDLAAARKYVQWWLGYNTSTLYYYNEWDDNYVGSMWPVGMTLADAMYYYWKVSIINFSGITGDFVGQTPEEPDPIFTLSTGEQSEQLFSSFRNFRTNYGCPPFGYNAANFGDQFYASKIVASNNCLLAQSTEHRVNSWNYNTCSSNSLDNDINFIVEGFYPELAFLNNPFFGGEGTRKSLQENYPSIIKIGNTYYPSINLSFDWLPEPNVYGRFEGETFSILRRGRVEFTCSPEGSQSFPSFTYLGISYQTAAGPYSATISGFPSGNSYQLPIYNIYSCDGDDQNLCQAPSSYVQCTSIPFNIEMGSIEMISV